MDIAKLIDQTFLKKEASDEKIKKICQETKEYGFRGLCLFPEYAKLAKKHLEGSPVKLTVLIDEPTGASASAKRIEMVKQAKKAGSDEVDVVMQIDDFKNAKHKEVLEDLKAICSILPTKVIIGSGYLTDEEIKKASQIVKTAGAICVKTATINDPLDHTELEEKAKHVRIMKVSAPGLLIKAAGSIRNFADLEMMVKAGADIIGTSSGIEIVNEAQGKKIKITKDNRIIE